MSAVLDTLCYCRRSRVSNLLIPFVLAALLPGGVATAGAWIIPGDMNCDLVVDYADVDPFVLALSGQAGYEAMYPDCDWLAADCSGDGVVDYADIDPFVDLILGPRGACCTGADPGPGYLPFECIGTVSESVCAAADPGTSWYEGESCDDPYFTCPRPIFYDLSPGSGAPPDTLGGYVMTPFDDDTRPTFESVTSVPSPCPYGDITFSAPLSHRKIGDGWMTWSHGYTGDVYFMDGTSVTITLAQPACAFYFYVEPNQFDEYEFEAIANGEVSTGTFTAHGSAGAVYVGFYGPVLETIEVINTDGAAGGFAIGEFGLACFCEPVYVACCDEATAVCVDAVELMSCIEDGGRWELDIVYCEDLVPPCGMQIGACCQGEIGEPPYEPYECIGDMTKADCLALGEETNWSVGESCDDPLFLCPGTPTYCDGSGGCDEFISRVVIDTIDNASGCTQYGDYTSMIAIAIMGVPLDLTVWNGNLYGGDETIVWVDWNQDKAWDDDGEFIGTVVGTEISEFTINVPPTAIPGYTRMRIRIDYYPPTPYEPCGTTTYGEVEDYTIFVSGDMPVGACCDPYTGLCDDNVEAIDCIGLEFYINESCSELSPECGNPGACCDDEAETCDELLELNCAYRFIGGVPCTPDPFVPPCGEWIPVGLLYAPTQPDNSAFRSAVSALLSGEPVDYYDARTGTPTLDMLSEYACVLTWVNYPYSDKVAMGDVLAEYVDKGGKVLLGQWTQPTAGNFLAGAIMEIGGPYLPATATVRGSGTYAGDGYGCPFAGVSTLTATYRDNCTVTDIGFEIGTWTDGYLCVAYRADNRVWANPGNTGSDYSTGEWAQLTANLCICPPGEARGACCDLTTGVCEDNVNVLDCIGFPLQWTYDTLCEELDPPCGAPGACCDDETGICTDEFEVNCPGRFQVGLTCAEAVFVPPCGEWLAVNVLYAPTNPDNVGFRAAVSALLGGSAVDYFDARAATPTLAQLQEYDCCLTWANYAYSDKVAMGDILADFVDAGGRVLLGQWTQPTAGNFLAGAIMEIGGPYLPATATVRGEGTYAGDGYGCEFVEVSELGATYRDNCTLTPIGFAIGTWTDGYLCVAYRADKAVWANPGNTGSDYSSGDWAQFTANLAACMPADMYGACCDLTTGLCTDNIEVMDCLGFPYQWTYDTLCDELVPVCGDPGACCDIYTGECTTEFKANCSPAFRFESGGDCDELEPPCGTPGACCDDDTAICTIMFMANCPGRFVAGALCDPDPFEPDCGEWQPVGMLYCPTQPDNATFRAAVSTALGGDPVDYYDARTGTPTLESLLPYACVMTWVNYAYADKVAMGDVLADYVDQGGKVLLAQWTQPTAGNYLAGRIMEVGGPYLPATATARASGSYAGDGYGCPFEGVSTLSATYRDNCTVTPIGTAIGTFTDGWLCVAYRGDSRVWASPGNTGLDYGTGDWAKLTANLCLCTMTPRAAAGRCDGKPGLAFPNSGDDVTPMSDGSNAEVMAKRPTLNVNTSTLQTGNVHSGNARLQDAAR